MNEQHLVATILFSLIFGAHAYSYKDAKNWGKEYPKCYGKNQSPISFSSLPVFSRLFPKGLKRLKLTDFDKLPTKMTIRNTGHTVELRADYGGKPPKISGGNLHGNYMFEKITFHWAQKRWSKDMGPNDMEMHMYFYAKRLKSFKKAESQKDGLAIFNVMLSSGPVFDGVSFDALENNLNKVESINSTTDIPPFAITSAVDPVPAYMYYKGSLDSPPCSESVTWFLYDSQVLITPKLLKGFRKVKLAEGDVSNFRPDQPPNNRKIKMMATE